MLLVAITPVVKINELVVPRANWPAAASVRHVNVVIFAPTRLVRVAAKSPPHDRALKRPLYVALTDPGGDVEQLGPDRGWPCVRQGPYPTDGGRSWVDR